MRSRSTAPDPRLVGEVLVEQHPRPAQTCGVDPHPPLAGAHQRGAGGLDAGEVGLGQRRVVDDRLPLDERLLAEPTLAVVGGRLAGGAAHADLHLHEVLGPEQLDAEPLQLVRRRVEEVVGLLEVELDGAGLVLGGQLGEAGHVGRDERGEREHLGLERREAGIRNRRRRARARPRSHTSSAVHQLPGSASSTSSSSTSHGSSASSGSVSRTRPRTTGSPSRRRRCRSSARPTSATASSKSSVPERMTGSGLASAANTPRMACTSSARLRPSSGRHPPWWSIGAGEAVGERGQDVVGGGDRPVAADGGGDRRARRRARRGARREHGPPAGDRERAFLQHLGHEPAGVDDADREAGERREPRERRRQVVARRRVAEPHRGAERVEPHGGDRAPPAARQVELDAAELAVRDGGVVPAALAAPAAATEPAVQPRCRCRRLAVPAPHVQRAGTPRALCDERRPVSRHQINEGTDGVWHASVRPPQGGPVGGVSCRRRRRGSSTPCRWRCAPSRCPPTGSCR